MSIFGNKPPANAGLSDLELLTQLSSGNLAGSLSSADKLLAVSGMLQALTRSGKRAGLTPGAVIENLQKQKMNEVQNRMAVEQLRQKAEDARKQAEYRAEISQRVGQPGQERITPDMLRELGQIAISRGDVEIGMKYLSQATELADAQRMPKPVTRDRYLGGQVIQEEFDPVAGAWKEYGRGSRFKPGTDVTVNVGGQYRGIPVQTTVGGRDGYLVPEE